MKALIIEDNPRLSVRIKQQLQKWYVTEIAESGDEGLQRASSGDFDLILLDLGLPDIPGLEVCRQIRKINKAIPILVVTGIDTTESKVELLDTGADDYITKPFELSELHARIESLLRRAARGDALETICIQDLTITPSKRHVERGGQFIQLRRKEFDILEYLARNAGRVMSREMIIHHAWPLTSNSWTGSVDVHIKQIRDKIDRPFARQLIKTSYGVGYMIEELSPQTHEKTSIVTRGASQA